MRIAAITPVWNEPVLIKGCIRSLAPHVEKHIVLVSQKPYYGSGVQDNTADVAESLGADVICGTWKLDHEQRNLGISLLQDFDWIITADADEMITCEQMEILKRDLESNVSDAYVVNHNPYWYDTKHCLVDFFKPIFAVRPSVRFSHIRNVNCRWAQSNARIDHLSWAKPKNILEKIKTYAHTDEIKNPDEWYNNHFELWSEGKCATMPTGETLEVMNMSLPEELKKCLYL